MTLCMTLSRLKKPVVKMCCFLVLFLLGMLQAVEATICYNMYRNMSTTVAGSAIPCSDAKCCSDAVTIEGFARSEFVSSTLMCTVHQVDQPTTEEYWTTIMFIKYEGCSAQPDLCHLPNLRLFNAYPIHQVNSKEDCLTLCRLGLNCLGVSYGSGNCLWTYNHSPTALDTETNDSYDTYIKCYLTTTTTAPTIATTTIISTITTTTTQTATTALSTTTSTIQHDAVSTAPTSTTTVSATSTSSSLTASTSGPESERATVSDRKTLLELEAQGESGSILDLHQYGVDIQHCHSFVYQVKGCQDHGLSLLDTNGVELVSLVIGAGSNSAISVAGEPSVSTPDVLSCNEFRWFWVRWSGNRVLYGSGMDTTASPTIDHTDDAVLLTKRLGLKMINSSPSVIRLGTDGLSRLERVLELGQFADGLIEEVPTNHFGACAMKCSNHADCGMFSFNEADDLCNIFNRMTSSFTVTSSSAWKSWKMLYCYQ